MNVRFLERWHLFLLIQKTFLRKLKKVSKLKQLWNQKFIEIYYTIQILPNLNCNWTMN